MRYKWFTCNVLHLNSNGVCNIIFYISIINFLAFFSICVDQIRQDNITRGGEGYLGIKCTLPVKEQGVLSRFFGLVVSTCAVDRLARLAHPCFSTNISFMIFSYEQYRFIFCIAVCFCCLSTAHTSTLQSTLSISVEMLHWTADVASRRRLQSAVTSTLVLPLTRRSTLGDRAFPVAASCAWNSLPASVRDIQSLPAFCQKLKLTLFSDSFAS